MYHKKSIHKYFTVSFLLATVRLSRCDEFRQKSSTDDYSVKIDGHNVTKGTLVLSIRKLKLEITSEIDLRYFKLRPGEGVVINVSTQATSVPM